MLFLREEHVAPLPVDVLAFASGANRIVEMEGFELAGHPIGVVASHLTAASVDTLCRSRNPVLVDSGAFSEVAIDENGIRVVDPISDAEWRRRLAIYSDIARRIGSHAYLVAPDQVGSQEETLRRLQRYRQQLADIASLGATILIPLQVGSQSHSNFYRMACDTVGFQMVPAMPMKKSATSIEDLLAFVQVEQPSRLHLLGIGTENSRARRIVLAIQSYSPVTKISMDSNRIRAVTGAGRPLTEVEHGLRASEPECLYGEIESPVLSMLGLTMDYTDLAASVSQWISPSQIETLAEYFPVSSRAAFLRDPDDFLQSTPEHSECAWIEHPEVFWMLDQMWGEHVSATISANVRAAAIVSVFRGQYRGAVS